MGRRYLAAATDLHLALELAHLVLNLEGKEVINHRVEVLLLELARGAVVDVPAEDELEVFGRLRAPGPEVRQQPLP